MSGRHPATAAIGTPLPSALPRHARSGVTPVALLRAAERVTEVRHDLVPDEDGAVPVCQRAHATEEVVFGLVAALLQDHRGVFAGMRVERRRERLETVVGERRQQAGQRRRDAGGPHRGARVPVLPAVVAAVGDALAPGVRARQADRRRRGVRAVLHEAHLLGARHEVDDALRDLDLERMEQREDGALARLSRHRFRDRRIGMAEQHCAERHRVVDVLVAVRIGDAAAAAADEILRIRAADELRRRLAERLRAGGNDAHRALPPCIGGRMPVHAEPSCASDLR
jgi:hypothetical protein